MSNEDASEVIDAGSADVSKTVEALGTVTKALQSLAQEERIRVLQSAAALFGVSGIGAPVNSKMSHGGAHAETLSAGPTLTNGSGKRLSVVEFLDEKSPATNPQRLVCFAYYRDKVEGESNFSKGDLSAYFAQAKLPNPGKNYSREYNQAVKEGWIHDSGSGSYVTLKGEKAVEAGFGGRGKPRGAAATKKRRGKKAE
jgi:hypothetical protein